MTVLIADTSALVSLAIAAGTEPDPLSLCQSEYDVRVPTTVIDELREIASYDDSHATAATVVLERTDKSMIHSVALDSEFPLDDGENAAVTLANETDAALFLCDEFNRLGLIHASLADTRLVTTPTLLSIFVRTDQLASERAHTLLDNISAERSWDGNAYVERARSLLDDT